MTWADYLAGQRLFVAGVEQSPRRNAWNLASGFSVAWNASTQMWDITASGGGGGGHTIEDEGTPLTARASLNFVGVNVSVADSGGKTVVTVGAISLAGSGVSGILPADRGGTGLSSSGTLGNVLTSNGTGGWVSAASSGGGVTDHGALTGLSDDDHTQYALVDGSRSFTGGVTVTQAAVAGGTPLAFRVTGGAHTASVAGAEIVDVDFGLNRTVQFATGALASQRAVRFRAPTYGFVGASVITDAATVAITGAPVAGTNATITRSMALWVQAGLGRFDGDLQVKAVSHATEVDNPTSTIDFTTGGLQKKTLSANTTLATPTPPRAFTDVRMRFAQPSSGGTYNYTLTFWAGILWVGEVPTMPVGLGKELIVCGYHDGTNWRLGGDPVPSQLPARGGENVVVDLYPSLQQQGTIANGVTVNFDVAIPTGKRYTITYDVWVDDGAGGACLYSKALLVKAHQTGGAAVKVDEVVVSAPLEGAGFTFAAAGSTTNMRGSLVNSSGSTRSYNIAVGFWSMDKP